MGRQIRSTIVLVAVVVALAAACRQGGGSKLSVSARSAATNPTSAGSLDLGNGILVSEVRIAVARVALDGGQDGGDSGDGKASALAADHGGGDGSGDGSGAGDGEDGEVKVGPCLVDLAGDALTAGPSAVAPVCAGEVPAGTYGELEVDIGPVAAADAGGVDGLSVLGGSSVVVDGTFAGQPFTFRSAVEVRQKTEGAIVVGASSNVTITVDPTGWFSGAGGAALDPSLAANRQAVEANIQASIRSFEDDDRDGEDDHGGGGGG